MINLRITLPPVLASNLVGLAGLIGLVVFIGLRTDWVWALGVASVLALGLAVLFQAAQRQAAAAATGQPAQAVGGRPPIPAGEPVTLAEARALKAVS